jgi:hypothetical protein
MALAAGALIGVLIIAGIGAFLLARSRSDQPLDTVAGSTAGGAVGVTGSGVTGSGEAGGGEAAVVDTGASPGVAGDPGVPIAVPTPMLGPINADYPRDHVVAFVNGQPYTMGELETAVRVAQVLGAFSGDVVPAYDSPDMPAFQVRMLRRQVDVLLMKQAAADAGVASPPSTVDELVDSFLFRVGSTRGQLEELMSSYGVAQEQLDAWFSDSADINTFIQEELMSGQDQTLRNEIAQAWLDEQWQTEQVYVDFYDPDALSIESGSSEDAGP